MASSESNQDRTLEPSARRLEQARREGQVPRSRYLAHLLVLGGGVAALIGLAAPLIASVGAVMARGLTFDATTLADPSRLATRLVDLSLAGLVAVAPVLAILLVAAALAPLAIGGWMFAPQLAAPKFERIDPGKGLGRLLSLQALAELLKVLIVTALLAVAGFWFVMSHAEELAGLAHQALPNALANFGALAATALALLAATLAVAAAIDVPFQIFQHRRRLRMTPDEARREQKETDGDPQLKARIRSAQRELARKRMMAAVPKADVVVTNPTHFAVALKYLEGRHLAPVVVAKGADAVAEKIKALAKEHGVPQLEAPPLARALYRHVEIGAEIPAALYGAVAQVLAYVFQLKRSGHAVAPVDIEVPEGLQATGDR